MFELLEEIEKLQNSISETDAVRNPDEYRQLQSALEDAERRLYNYLRYNQGLVGL